jgi:hypothetical protein
VKESTGKCRTGPIYPDRVAGRRLDEDAPRLTRIGRGAELGDVAALAKLRH